MNWNTPRDDEGEREAAEQKRDYEEGQRDGANAKFIDEIVHETVGQAQQSEAYNLGWKNGNENPSKK